MPERERVQAVEKNVALDARILDKLLLFIDAEIMRGAHEVGEVTAERRTDAARQTEAIILHLIESWPSHHTAHLRLLAERQQVRNNTMMLTRPAFASDAHAGLNFVKDQQHIVLIRQLPEQSQKLRTEMIIAALALDRLNDDRGDVHSFGGKHVADFFLGNLFFRDDISEAFLFRQGEVQHRCADARPGELSEVLNLARVGVGQAHRVTGTTVERMFEMDDLRATFAMTGSDVLANLPIHRSLEGVLDRERAAINEKVAGQFRQRDDARERFDERGKLRRVHIRIGNLHL